MKNFKIIFEIPIEADNEVDAVKRARLLCLTDPVAYSRHTIKVKDLKDNKTFVTTAEGLEYEETNELLNKCTAIVKQALTKTRFVPQPTYWEGRKKAALEIMELIQKFENA